MMEEERPTKKLRHDDDDIDIEATKDRKRNEAAMASALTIFQIDVMQSSDMTMGPEKASEDSDLDPSSYSILGKLKYETRILEELSCFIKKRLERNYQQRTNMETQQKENWLNTLDKGIQGCILEFLDEEGLWALDESSIMENSNNQTNMIMKRWKVLFDQQKFGICDKVREKDYFNARTAGLLFGKASRLARSMETSPLGNSLKKVVRNVYIPHIDKAGYYFIRLSYRDAENDGAIHVMEGFSRHKGGIRDDLLWRCADAICLPFDESATIGSNIIGKAISSWEGVGERSRQQAQANKVAEQLRVTVLRVEFGASDPVKLVVAPTNGFDRLYRSCNNFVDLSPSSLCDFPRDDSLRVQVGRKGGCICVVVYDV